MKTKLEKKLKKLKYKTPKKHNPLFYSYTKEYPTNENEQDIKLSICITKDKISGAYMSVENGWLVYLYKDVSNISNAYEILTNDLKQLEEHFDTFFAIEFERDYKH